MMPSIQVAMTKKLVTIAKDASACFAEQLMNEKRIRHLLVVDPDSNEAVGVLSNRQLQLLRMAPSTEVEWLMSSPIVSVDPSTPLRLAIFKILENKISALIVADSQDEVLGIVTTDDLLWYLAHSLELEDKKGHWPSIGEDTKVTLGEIMNRLSAVGI